MFDSTKPEDFAPIDAGVLRAQFNALKALNDGLTAQVTTLVTQMAGVQAALTLLQSQFTQLANIVPIGAVIPWFKDLPGTPPLPANFVECNGGTVSDPDSPINGAPIPDINIGAQRFVRGGLTSGQLGGIDYFATAQADYSGIGPAQNFVTTDFSPGAIPIPPFVTAVHVMRVK